MTAQKLKILLFATSTEPKLVPYGAMTSTFYTGLGCLMGPSVLFFATRALIG